MDGKLRNMTSVYITNKSKNKMLLLFRQGGKVVNNVWVGAAGGHFEECELNDAKACVLRELEEELGSGKVILIICPCGILPCGELMGRSDRIISSLRS